MGILCAPSGADAATEVGGTISGANWTKDKSPYVVTNNVFVDGLNIREGVEVQVWSNCVSQVAGRLRVLGKEGEPVWFHPADTNAGWQGILSNDAVPGSYFVHTIIE
jgi:hypothetical protein